MTKKCPHCKRELTSEHYYKCTSAPDGLQSWCKECNKESNRMRYKLGLKKISSHDEIKHNLIKLKNYRKNKGLEYTFIGNKKKGKNRKIIYKCLECGQMHKSSLKEALNFKFTCPKCSSNYPFNWNNLENKVRVNAIKPILPVKQSFNPFVTTLTFVKHLFRKPKNVISYNMDEVESVLYSGNRVEITLKGKDLHSQNAKAK